MQELKLAHVHQWLIIYINLNCEKIGVKGSRLDQTN